MNKIKGNVNVIIRKLAKNKLEKVNDFVNLDEKERLEKILTFAALDLDKDEECFQK